MPISYKKLFELMRYKGLKKVDLRKNGFSPTIVDRLVKDGDVNTSTIIRLCEMLDCQPGDIMERVDKEGFTRLTPSLKGAKELSKIEARQSQNQKDSDTSIE